MTARTALALGTIHGARCLGRDDELGSLEPGKLADVALWRLDDAGHAGIADPVTAMAMGPPRHAEALLVDGAPVVRAGELLTGDLDAIARAAAATALRPA
jgi:imidazolonepropionase-like amidohydrolase